MPIFPEIFTFLDFLLKYQLSLMKIHKFLRNFAQKRGKIMGNLYTIRHTFAYLDSTHRADYEYVFDFSENLQIYNFTNAAIG